MCVHTYVYFVSNLVQFCFAEFNPHIADTKISRPDTERVRIAFLLTLNGRALRQVHRLIKTLYSPDHVFYIHVDAVYRSYPSTAPARQPYGWRRRLSTLPG